MSVHKVELKSQDGRRKRYAYRVKWRLAGTGPQQSKTVDNRPDAEALDDALRDLGWALPKTDPRVATLSLIGAKGGLTEETRQDALNMGRTLREAVEEWVTRPDLSWGSQRTYRATLNRLGPLGDRPLGAVSERELKGWLATERKTLSDNSVRLSEIVLNGTLAAAGRPRLSGKAKYRGKRKVEPILLNAEQRKLAIAAAEDIDAGLMAKIALGCGLRVGELAALQVKHLHALDDAEEARIRVRQLLPQEVTRAGGFQPGPLKTDRSERDVPIPTTLRLELLERFGEADPEMVVCRPSYAGFWTFSPLHKHWRRAMTKAEGLPSETRIHDLRHTYGKILLSNGYPLSWVSELLGHESPKVTAMVYGGFDQQSVSTARAILDMEG
jgi:integrase